MTLLAHRIRKDSVQDKLREKRLSEAITGSQDAITMVADTQHREVIAMLSEIASMPDGSAQLKMLSRQIASIPKPKDLDLKPLIKAIVDIPVVEQKDYSDQFERLHEEMGKKRVHTFEVIREPINGLIEKIVVTET